MKVVFDKITAECEDLCSTNNKSKFRLADTDSLKNWSFKDQENELQAKAPTFLRGLQAAAVNIPSLTINREGRKRRKDYASTILPGIMSAAGTLLQCRNKDMIAHATITGLQLKSGGATKLTHMRLQARSLDVKDWKASVENDTLNLRKMNREIGELEAKINQGVHEFPDFLQRNKLLKEKQTLLSNMHPGYQLVGDNIDFTLNPRHQTTEHGKKNIHYFNFLAVKNKVSGNEYPDDKPAGDVKSTPLSAYLPDHADNLKLREEWVILAGQIITYMIPAFEDFKSFPDHIDHEYSHLAKQKSEVVGLGVVTESENTNDGIAKILDHLQGYDPLGNTNDPVKIFSTGDQLTAERESNSQEGRRDSQPKERWAGLLPQIADFHAIGNFYEWIFKQLYSEEASGCRDIGTLYAAKTFWKLTNIPKKPLDNFYAVEDLIDRYVKALILTAALDFFGMSDINSQPTKHMFNSEESTKENYIVRKVGELIDKYAIQHEPDALHVEEAIKCPAEACKKTYRTRKGLKKHLEEKHPTVQLPTNSNHQNATIADYCRTALGMCLLAYNFTDARRHGDGGRIIRLYKFFTLHFKAANKHKYAFHCLRLQIQLKCLLTPRLAHQLTWNRFVNNQGKVDSNVELDRENEHRNKAIKQECRGFKGKLSDTSIKRVGEVAQLIEQILARIDSETTLKTPSGTHSHVDVSSDILSLVDVLHQEKVFEDDDTNRRIHVLPDFQKDPFSRLDLIALHTWMKDTVKKVSDRKVFN
ncbi:LOW QUALITY PROTEIN: uncharacterized protein [Amphiura filiformis]|uniref:LOW QUALITY PROTEIN: uncharacterized protein n=1 Tax=Amphiura filiformis TaxID=82378 RepID=UPI003B219255